MQKCQTFVTSGSKLPEEIEPNVTDFGDACSAYDFQF